jgi:hypothetical protein
MPEDAAAEAYGMVFLVESGFAQKSTRLGVVSSSG